MRNLGTCPLCGVEYLGVASDHDCERDAWARPHPQPIGPRQTPEMLDKTFDDLNHVAS